MKCNSKDWLAESISHWWKKKFCTCCKLWSHKTTSTNFTTKIYLLTRRLFHKHNKMHCVCNSYSNKIKQVCHDQNSKIGVLILYSDVKGIPGCFFTRTSLLKSSNNLEPICNDVNIKCSWLVIFRIISVTSTFTLWETCTTSVNLTNLK